MNRNLKVLHQSISFADVICYRYCIQVLFSIPHVVMNREGDKSYGVTSVRGDVLIDSAFSF